MPCRLLKQGFLGCELQYGQFQFELNHTITRIRHMYESKLTKKDTKLRIDFPPADNSECITASESIFHQLLAALKKEEENHQTSQKGLEPPANQVIKRGLSPLPIK
jgi:hypothetical protein